MCNYHPWLIQIPVNMTTTEPWLWGNDGHIFSFPAVKRGHPWQRASPDGSEAMGDVSEMCTWTSSSSSLCLRLLYRNMSGLLRASPDQNHSYLSLSPPPRPSAGPSAAHRCTPPRLRLSEELNSGSTRGVNVYSHTDGSQIRPRVKRWVISESPEPSDSIHC